MARSAVFISMNGYPSGRDTESNDNEHTEDKHNDHTTQNAENENNSIDSHDLDDENIMISAWAYQ